MEALTTILFLAGIISIIALTVRRRNHIRQSNLQSGMLTPHLDAALRNGDAGAIVTLCHNYDDSSLGRIVKAVFARAEAFSGSDGVRSDALRLLIEQAATHEKDRIKSGLGVLRAASIVAAPIGVAVGAMTAYSAIFSAPTPTTGTDLSDAMINAAEGLILSIVGFIAYKSISAQADTELETVEELCDHLHGLLLSRGQEPSPDPKSPGQ
jgi:biopolymer transport protein ExbB/TolQ